MRIYMFFGFFQLKYYHDIKMRIYMFFVFFQLKYYHNIKMIISCSNDRDTALVKG
jgi:hypothetical protein